jgi:hypothetical protein
MRRLKSALAVSLVAVAGLVALGLGVMLVAVAGVMGGLIMLAARIGMSAKSSEQTEVRTSEKGTEAVA